MSTIKLPKALTDLYFQKVALQVEWHVNENATTMWLPRNETIDDILRYIMEAAKNTKHNPPFPLPIGSDGENPNDIPDNYALYLEDTQPLKKLHRLRGVLDYQRFVRDSRNKPLNVRLVRAFPRLGSEEYSLRKGEWAFVQSSSSFVSAGLVKGSLPIFKVKVYPSQTDDDCFAFALEVIKEKEDGEKKDEMATLTLKCNDKPIMPNMPLLLRHGDRLTVEETTGEPKVFHVAYDLGQGNCI